MSEGTYFDAVLDEEYTPVYNDTPEKVRVWVEQHRSELAPGTLVCVGKTLNTVTVDQYLS